MFALPSTKRRNKVTQSSTRLDLLRIMQTLRQVAQVVFVALQGYFYYIFGFCFVVGALTVIITIEVAIVTTYVQLCAEDYQWW